MIFLVQLLLAHLIGDFFLQPNKWIKDKEEKKWESPYLYLHISVHFLLIIAITRSFSLWKPALIIAFSHFFIDLTKLIFQKANKKRGWFFIDQALHLTMLLIVWSYINNKVFDYSLLNNKIILVPVVAIFSLLNPASIMIKTVISKWPPNPIASQDQESLQSAGKWIGMLERLLVFTFIISGKWEGVGFLLAAKSVFRFGDLKDAKNMKLTEYVLIGTLLSFGVAILIGILTISFVQIKILPGH